MDKKEQGKYLYNQIVDQIQRMIGSGEFKVGDRLPAERVLAQTFRVSRNCLRQAIQALSEKGILESRRGDGTYVRTPNRALFVNSLALAINAQKDVLREIIEFRLLLEPQIAYLAARNITSEQLDRLKVIVCDQERRIMAGAPDVELDVGFHSKLGEASGNRVIRQVFGMLNEILNESRSEFLQSDSRRRSSVLAHLRIIDALERRDADAAFQAMKQHLLRVEREIFGENAGTDGKPDCVG